MKWLLLSILLAVSCGKDRGEERVIHQYSWLSYPGTCDSETKDRLKADTLKRVESEIADYNDANFCGEDYHWKIWDKEIKYTNRFKDSEYPEGTFDENGFRETCEDTDCRCDYYKDYFYHCVEKDD